MNNRLKLFELLRRDSLSLFENAHNIYTSKELTFDVLSKLSLDNKNVLVMFNPEFVISLVEIFKVPTDKITFYSDHKNKSLLMSKFGVKYIEELGAEMKFDIIVGNPPYTDGSEGESNLYQKIVYSTSNLNTELQSWILPNSWFLSNTSEHKKFREYIFKAGLKKIIINPMNAFENAKVKTGTIICEKGYLGDVEVLSPNGSYTISASNRGKCILPVNNETAHSLIITLTPENPYVLKNGKNTSSPRKALKDVNFSKTKTDIYKFPIVTKLAKDIERTEYVYSNVDEDPDSDKWRVAIPYLATGYASGDMKFGAVGVIPNDGTQLCGYYRYLVVENVERAETLQKYFMSKFVRFILHFTRTSRTLDNPQMRFIPTLDITNKNITDNDIYKHFNLSADEIKEIDGCSFKWTS